LAGFGAFGLVAGFELVEGFGVVTGFGGVGGFGVVTGFGGVGCFGGGVATPRTDLSPCRGFTKPTSTRRSESRRLVPPNVNFLSLLNTMPSPVEDDVDFVALVSIGLRLLGGIDEFGDDALENSLLFKPPLKLGRFANHPCPKRNFVPIRSIMRVFQSL
jgi:hypothetical protein